MSSAITFIGAGSVLLSGIATALLIVAVIIPQFVEVYIPSDVNNPTADPPLAGVGVFTSEYDFNAIPVDTALAANVPDQTFSVATTEFPMLFPARENFIADILPLNQQALAAIDAALEVNIASNVIGPLVLPILQTEFEDCEQFLSTQFTNLNTLFNAIVLEFIPLLFDFTFGESVSAPFNGLLTLLEDSLDPLNPIRGLVLGSFPSVVSRINDNCGGFELDSEITAANQECVVREIGEEVTTNPAVNPLNAAALVQISAVIAGGRCVDQAFLPCFSSLDYSIRATPFGAPVEAVANDGFCGLASVGICAFTFFDYLLAIRAILQSVANPSADALVAIGGINFLESLVAPVDPEVAPVVLTTSTLGLPFNLNGGLDVVTFTEFYPACFPFTVGDNALARDDCTFNKVLPGIIASGQAGALQPVLELLDSLFTRCEAAGVAGPGLCGPVFSIGFVNASFLDGVAASDPTTLVANAVLNCEDDNIDLEKIEQAQLLIIAGIILSGITVLVAIMSLCLAPRYVMFGGALFAASGAVFVISALATVATAPIYASVGGEPEAFAPLFVQGPVTLIALAAVGMQFLVAILLIIGGIVACRIAPRVEEVKEVTNPYEVKAAEEA